MRLSSEEIQKICDEKGVSDLWSYSRLSSFSTSRWEWYLKYIVHASPQAPVTSIYGPAGNLVHETIEDFYEGKIKRSEMLQKFEDEFTVLHDVLGYRFDRTSEEKDERIRNKYEADVCHFMKHWQPISNKCVIEEFLLTKVTDDIYVQGYADAQFIGENNGYTIVDFKTSTAYSPKSLVEHSAQLSLYAEALRQRGIPKENIFCEFLFIKYCQVDYQMASGKWNTTIVERCELGQKMTNRVTTWLKKLGYDPDDYVPEMISNNTFDNLPEDVRSKFKMLDYYLEVPNPCDLYENTYKQWVIDTVAEIDKINTEYEATGDEKVWYDTKAQVKKESFYFANLSGYSVNQLPQYKEFLDNQQKVSNIIRARKNKESSDDDDSNVSETDDMSWLEGLT